MVLAEGHGAWVTDVDGKRYLDCLAGYSALNFGHGHPRLLARAHEQLDKLTLTSRAFFNDQLGPFARDLAALTGKDLVLPMNSGAEAVETSIKVSRRWGYQVKGVAEAQASIVVMEGNFHGRTTTIVSFSNDSDATAGYAPYTPGFRMVPYGDIAAVRAAIDETTVAVLLEPIQGEGGVIIPPEGFLREVRDAVQRDQRADGGRRDPVGPRPLRHHLRVRPRGRRPRHLRARQGARRRPLPRLRDRRRPRRARRDHPRQPRLDVRRQPAGRGHRPARSWRCCRPASSRTAAVRLGARLDAGLAPLVGNGFDAVRIRGLWCGIDITDGVATGREVTEALLAHGVLAKEAHGQTVRLAPPLVATEDDIDLLVAAFQAVMESFSG